METFWLIAIPIFLFCTYVIYRLSVGRFRKENSEKMRKLWGARVYYWEGVIMLSSGATFFFLLMLKWTNLINF